MSNILSTFRTTIPSGLYTGFEVKEDFMPDTPINCISLVLETTGQSIKYFGQKDSLESPTVTMTVRSNVYDTGHAVAEAIRYYFDMYYDGTLLSVHASSGVIPLGKDENGYRQFMVQFTIIIKE
jgi:hypothetical protein